MTQRRGASSLGCLFTLMIVVAVCYFGINIGQVYWHYYEFRDDMRQEARFADHLTNDSILVHLRADADSLGLPDEASDIGIRRSKTLIIIESEYDETIELPGQKRDVHFHPYVEGPL